jgi:exopolysaccharide biosynthesis operon protein EpsL
MNPRYSWRARRRGLVVFIGIACLQGASARADEGDTLNFGLAASRTLDDNVFRLAPTTDPNLAIGSPEKGDTSTATTLSIAVDKTLGRQRLKLDTHFSTVRYERFKLLNHEPSDLKAVWQWQFGNRLRGELSASHRQSLSGFGDFRTPVKNIVTNESGYGSLYLKVGADWEAFASATRSEATNSNGAQLTSNSRTEAMETGLRHTSGSGNWLSLRLRHLDAPYPNLQLAAGTRVDNSFRQNDIEADGAWQLTGASRINGRIGRTQRRHAQVSARDYSGATGRISWDWQPTGKTLINLAAKREIGGNSDEIATYVVTRRLAFAPSWTPTAKTRLQLSLERSQRSFAGDPGFILGALPKREDNIRTASLSASYAPHRSLLFSVSLQDDRRDSNYAGLPYRDRTTYLSAQFSF